MLCIDVSGSMDGKPILEAVRGAKNFVREAVAGPLQSRRHALEHAGNRLQRADGRREGGAEDAGPGEACLGGNNLIGPLERCHQILDRFKDDPDRVVALFGDGDLTPKGQVLSKVAQMKAENIRFVTRGLGAAAAQEFGTISSEEPSSAAIGDVGGLADGIATMAASLKPRGLAG